MRSTHLAKATSCLVAATILWGTLFSQGSAVPGPPGGDKIIHAIAFAALVFPVTLAQPRKWLIYVIFAVIFGGIIELIQPFVGRNSEWLDFVFDGFGVLVGVIGARFVRMAYLPGT